MVSGDSVSSSVGFYDKLKRWKAVVLSSFFELNKTLLESNLDLFQIKNLAIQMEREISRRNDLYTTEHGFVVVFGSPNNHLLGLPLENERNRTTPVPPTVLPNMRVESIPLL